MIFDIVIGNPPYQKLDGGYAASAVPLYHYFIQLAKRLNPEYICMIIPSRWMVGGRGLDSFRKEMLSDRHITKLYDYINSDDVFHGVGILGGVCYFLRERDSERQCEIHTLTQEEEKVSIRYLDSGDGIFIRLPELIAIKDKVLKKGEETFDNIVSTRSPYGFETDVLRNVAKYGLPPFADEPIEGGYSILGLGGKYRRTWGYLPKDYPIPKKSGCLFTYKVFITKAYGKGTLSDIPSEPVLSAPGELCTETFLEIGPFETKKEASHVILYIRTKFFRALVGIQKQTQQASKCVYSFVPMQDFTDNSDIDWNLPVCDIDKALYKKYGLSKEEIEFIEANIKPMKGGRYGNQDG